jgi:hypothetical protein
MTEIIPDILVAAFPGIRQWNIKRIDTLKAAYYLGRKDVLVEWDKEIQRLLDQKQGKKEADNG